MGKGTIRSSITQVIVTFLFCLLHGASTFSLHQTPAFHWSVPWRSKSSLSAANSIDEDSAVVSTSWSPRSRLWWKDEEMIGLSRELNFAHGPTTTTILEDMVEEESASVPMVKMLHSNNNGKIVAVEISSALTTQEAHGVHALASAVRNHIRLNATQFEHRSFGPQKGGNDCTYLSPLIQKLQPNTAAKIVSLVEMAWEHASWNKLGEQSHGGALGSTDTSHLPSQLPNPNDLGIRTSEHLCYDGWRSLEPHKDVGSIYTIMIALKEPNDYEGGEFFFQTSFLDQTDIKPNQLSAIVFLSDTVHGVRPITSGIRESFVTELWTHDDAPLGMNRPTVEEWEAKYGSDQRSA